MQVRVRGWGGLGGGWGDGAHEGEVEDGEELRAVREENRVRHHLHAAVRWRESEVSPWEEARSEASRTSRAGRLEALPAGKSLLARWSSRWFIAQRSRPACSAPPAAPVAAVASSALQCNHRQECMPRHATPSSYAYQAMPATPYPALPVMELYPAHYYALPPSSTPPVLV